MQTLRQVLGREEERQNLKNMGLCYLLIVVLMALVFVVVYTNLSSLRAPVEDPTNQVTHAVRSDM